MQDEANLMTTQRGEATSIIERRKHDSRFETKQEHQDDIIGRMVLQMAIWKSKSNCSNLDNSLEMIRESREIQKDKLEYRLSLVSQNKNHSVRRRSIPVSKNLT